MSNIPFLVYPINGILLIVVLVAGVLLLKNASLYNYAVGDDAKQAVLKYKVLKLIVLISGIAFAAAVFNLLTL
ncbi:MAG: hypothetical protein WD200_01765 [Candidatus Andersenbacteria bacterium]